VNAPADLPLGVIDGMPPARYHAIHAMSAGGLKRMRQSPAHFYGLQLDPNRPPQGEPTPALVNGTLMHCALFEPAEFERRYVVLPADAPRRPTDAQWAAKKPSPESLYAMDWWRDFNERAAGAEIITAAQRIAAQRQADAIRALPDVAALLSDGVGERSCFWIDAQTGEHCKCRPDWTSPAGDGVILTDGKTCQDASPQGFAKTVVNFDYTMQAAWYSDGYEATTGVRVHGFVFAAVESTWPHAAAAYMLGDDDLERARRECRRLVNSYAECKRTGEWPGYQAGVSLLTLPRWAFKEIG
jgi:hypothetical protein